MSPITDETGSIVAEKYRLRRIVGEGGMGVVYAATHLWTDREVAVKVLHPYYARDEHTVHRFMREARAAARLHHPHVVDVLDMGQRADGSVYMVMDLLVGETLAEMLRREGALDPGTALEYVMPIMDALAVAHDRGIVHRDIKPDNIFLTRDTRTRRIVPKLLDFGVAKVAQASGGGVTEAGAIVGTPAYMSPEQVRGSGIGPESDIWSIGVVLYEAMSADLPFPGETPTGILAAILTEDLPPLRETASQVPIPLAGAIEQALRKDPGERPESMRDFQDRLFDAAATASIALEGRISRIEWDPSMAEPQTESLGETTLGAVTRSLAPLASRAAWVFGLVGLIVVAVALGAFAMLRERPSRGGETAPHPTASASGPQVDVAKSEPGPPAEGDAAQTATGTSDTSPKTVASEPPVRHAPSARPRPRSTRPTRSAPQARRPEAPATTTTPAAPTPSPAPRPAPAGDTASAAAASAGAPSATAAPSAPSAPSASAESADGPATTTRIDEGDLLAPPRWRDEGDHE